MEYPACYYLKSPYFAQPITFFRFMRKITVVLLFITLFLSRTIAQNNPDTGNWRDKVAVDILAQLDRGEHPDLIAVFHEQADVSGAREVHGKSEKARYVFSRLQETAARSQARAIRFLRARNAFLNSFYLVNAIAVKQADAATVEGLANMPEIARLAPDPAIALQPPLEAAAPPSQRGTVEWGIAMINAPAVWALGYKGQGITVAGADTGYEWEHPALKEHYRGYNNLDGTANHNYNWHDAIHAISPLSGDSIPDPANNPCGVNSPVPCDDHNHGTHTMGTMVGDDNQGNQIGVAPGAKWVACRNMERGNGQPSSYIECFEWFLAPTDINGQNPNPEKAPHVINNSWICPFEEGCTDLSIDQLILQAIVNLRASGVVVVVSNGNSGSQGCGSTDEPPAYFEDSFSVGATANNDTITNFSSRGPVLIDSSFRIKPNVVAPGAAVRSSVRNGGYAHFWGTSMAGPHVVGLVALVLSARPDLAGEVDLIEDIIEQTAVPKFDGPDCSDNNGQAYPNNTYGYGRVDALAAVLKALTVVTPVSGPAPATVSAAVYPNPVTDEALVELSNYSGKITLEIYNAAGQNLYSTTRIADQSRMLLRIPMAQEPRGVYFWRVWGAGTTQTGKFIKQ